MLPSLPKLSLFRARAGESGDEEDLASRFVGGLDDFREKVILTIKVIYLMESYLRKVALESEAFYKLVTNHTNHIFSESGSQIAVQISTNRHSLGFSSVIAPDEVLRT